MLQLLASPAEVRQLDRMIFVGPFQLNYSILFVKFSPVFYLALLTGGGPFICPYMMCTVKALTEACSATVCSHRLSRAN